MVEDYNGWPSPDSPDRSSQLFSRDIAFLPIDLPYEGYDSVEVSINNAPDGLNAFGSIDYNLVTLEFDAMCPSAETEDVEVSFSAYVIGSIGGYKNEEEPMQLKDVIAKGVLHIVAGSITNA